MRLHQDALKDLWQAIVCIVFTLLVFKRLSSFALFPGLVFNGGGHRTKIGLVALMSECIAGGERETCSLSDACRGKNKDMILRPEMVFKLCFVSKLCVEPRSGL